MLHAVIKAVTKTLFAMQMTNSNQKEWTTKKTQIIKTRNIFVKALFH